MTTLPAAYLVDGPGFWDAVQTDEEALLREAEIMIAGLQAELAVLQRGARRSR